MINDVIKRDKKLKELITLKSSPYFGKINFIDSNFDDE